jgi:hypothetical protein
MSEVTIVIGNNSAKSKKASSISDITKTFEGTTFKQALRKALTFGQETLNSQYDAPSVSINGINIDDKDCMMMKADRMKWEYKNFLIVYSNVYSLLGTLSPDTIGTQFIRDTDTNGTFQSVNKFTVQQVAAQAVAFKKKMSDTAKYVMEDAVDSMEEPWLKARRENEAKKLLVKRIAAKQLALNSK